MVLPEECRGVAVRLWCCRKNAAVWQSTGFGIRKNAAVWQCVYGVAGRMSRCGSAPGLVSGRMPRCGSKPISAAATAQVFSGRNAFRLTQLGIFPALASHNCHTSGVFWLDSSSYYHNAGFFRQKCVLPLTAQEFSGASTS